ncbi:MAG: hypothetical protein GY953_13255, partial [bacterium]|nr:hypothetical protein [bacterium]
PRPPDPSPSAAPLPHLALPIRVLMDGREAEVIYAGVAPGLICALAQINALVGVNVTPGVAVSLQVFAGAFASQEGVTFTVVAAN